MKKSILSFVTLILILSSPLISLAQDWSTVGDFIAEAALPAQVIEFEDDLIVCGEFTTVLGEDMGQIIRWDGTEWAPMGTGITGDFKCIGVAGGELFVGGVLIGEDQVDQQSIYKWDGTNWVGTGNATDVGYPYALTEWNGQLVAATRGSGVNNSIRMYNGGTSWTQLGEDINPEDFYEEVNALAVYNDTLYMAGTFGNVGINQDAQEIAKFNGQSWISADFPMPAPDPDAPNNGEVYVLEVHDGKLFAGGQLHDYGGEQWSRPCLAYYDGSSWTAFDIDEDYPSTINSLESDGEHLYCGGEIGYFDEGVITSGVVVFDESDENNFINLNFYNEAQPYSDVIDLTMLDGSLIASGSFLYAGSAEAWGIAEFNGVFPQPTAINENHAGLSQGFELYPNPSSEFLTIELPMEGKITIHNSVGSVVYEEFSRKLSTIETATWESGLYYVECITAYNRVTRKFIKI